MLYFYTDKKYFDESEFIFNVDTAIIAYGFKINEFTEKVIREIDKAKLISNFRVIDRFGNVIYISNISCSSKAMLLLNNLGLEKVINFSEVGLEVGKVLYNVNEGRIYLSSLKRIARLISSMPDDARINVNNKDFEVKEFVDKFGECLNAYERVIGVLPEIDFNIRRNGLYFFNNESGIGKTYLADSVASYCTDDLREEFCVVTVQKGRGVHIDVTGNMETAKVIICDRFDMYESEELFNKLCTLAESKIVMLAFKDYVDYVEEHHVKCHTGYITLKLEESKLIVRG